MRNRDREIKRRYSKACSERDNEKIRQKVQERDKEKKRKGRY